MAELKTQKTRASVKKFLQAIEPSQRRDDALQLAALMEELTGEKPALWGESIVGFGSYRYKYKTGWDGEWFVTGFSPRKANLTLYIMCGFERTEELMKKLGKYKTGKSCLYVKRLADLDFDVLRKLITASVAFVREKEASGTWQC